MWYFPARRSPRRKIPFQHSTPLCTTPYYGVVHRGVECWKGIFRLGDLLAGKYHIRYQYCTLYIIKNPTRPMIDDSNCHGDKAPTIKPTSVLSKIISRINYLSLARSRIDSSIRIPPHNVTSGCTCTKPE